MHIHSLHTLYGNMSFSNIQISQYDYISEKARKVAQPNLNSILYKMKLILETASFLSRQVCCMTACLSHAYAPSADTANTVAIIITTSIHQNLSAGYIWTSHAIAATLDCSRTLKPKPCWLCSSILLFNFASINKPHCLGYHQFQRKINVGRGWWLRQAAAATALQYINSKQLHICAARPPPPQQQSNRHPLHYSAYQYHAKKWLSYI